MKIKTFQAEPLFEVHNTLGEGPLWHPLEQQLYWVDIDRGDLYQSDPDMQSYTHNHFDTSLGAFGFCKDSQFILATGRGFAAWSPDRDTLDTLWNPLPDRSAVRLNDGKVDPAGRFWAGSIDTEKSQGALYRLDPDGSQHTLLHGIGISNGLDWSPNHKVMYYTDSMQYTIFAFDYDLESGAITHQRCFVELPKTEAEIVPDGLCVDAEGCIWSAQWNGWQVVRYSPKGEALVQVKLPTQRVTACCFGGTQLDQLFITTARAGLSEAEAAHQPHAGDVFICQTGTQGQPANFFQGGQS